MEIDICSAKKRGRDLTIDTLKIANKESVRDVIILVPSDVAKKRDKKYVFSLSYKMGNVGYMGARDFENLAYFNDNVVSRQQSLSLGPNDSKVINDEVILDAVDGTIIVRLDAFSRIAEDDETNNDVTAKLVFRGFDGAKIPPQLHIELMRIMGRPARDRIKLSKKEAVDEKKGRYAYPVEFVIRNYGTTNAEGFDNVFLLNGKGFFRDRNLSLKAGESRLIEMPIYFPVHDGKFTVQIDGDKKYTPSKEHKQALDVQLYFQGFSS